jgi:GT2 family glycosyltransferase/glycosyltransferase involved in cell wall biosynthesis
MATDPMKIVHVANYAPGQSGLYGTVCDILKAERRLGAQADFIDDQGNTEWYGQDDITPVPISAGEQADIICWHHAMVEDWFNEPHRNIVLFLHGTPEFNFHTELNSNDRTLSLIVGAANTGVAKGFITLWKRHVPFWEHLLRRPVHYVNAWCDVPSFQLSPKVTERDTIRIALVDFWRLTREPFGLFHAVEWLRRNTTKKIELDCWGMPDFYHDVYRTTAQYLFEDDVLSMRGPTLDKHEIYHSCDLVLSMSTEETRVVREAYACGVPVVCGRTGLDFTEYQADCLRPDLLGAQINACHEDLIDDTKRMREELRCYAEKNFDVGIAAPKIMDVYEEIIREHGSVNRPKHFLSQGVRMVAGVDETAEKVKAGLTAGQSFHYVRFGDGDLLLIAGAEGESFHRNSPELQAELTEAFTIKDPDYLVSSVAGMANEKRMRKGLFARFAYDDELRKVVEGLRPGETLLNPIALAYKFVFEATWFSSFVREGLRDKRVLFVGNKAACDSSLVKSVFSVATTIEVPDRDSYYSMPAYYPMIEQAAQSHDIIICAAGMATRVISKRLWKSGCKTSFIDIGSIIDSLVGVGSRTWIRMLDGVREHYEEEFLRVKTDIVVLSYKNEEKTIRCFDALAKHTDDFRLIWVDNGSGAESVQTVKDAIQDLQLDLKILELPRNIGFSGGVNKALRMLLAEEGDVAPYVCLLNNDVIVTPGWLDRLRFSMEQAGFDAIGPLTSEGNPQALAAFREVDKTLPEFKDEDPDTRARILWDQNLVKVMQVGNMISFFCTLLKRTAIEQTGLLDEKLFAYGEDNDYCIRLLRDGKKIGVALGAYVHHDHHATADLMGDDWRKNQQEFARKYLEKKYGGAK